MVLPSLNKKSKIRRVIYLNYEIENKSTQMLLAVHYSKGVAQQQLRTRLKVYKTVIQS